MKKIQLITAILVSLFIYGVVIERDTLVGFARNLATPGDPAPVGKYDNTTEEPLNTRVDAPRVDPAVSVVAVHSVAAEVQSGLVLRGQTEAARRVEVRSEGAGRVVSEPLRKGASVYAGQVLCHLDTGTLDAQLAEARARQSEAEASANTATQLAERGFGPENSAIAALAGLESAKANVQRVERMIEQLDIRAPFDGLLESDTAELGSLLQPGAPCATVIALDEIKLVGFVPELDVPNLEVGQQAGAEFLSGQQVLGRVTFISRSADPLTRTFRLEVRIPNPGLTIREGQTVQIAIAYAGERAHLLPENVLTLDDEGTLGVRIAQDDVAKFVPVQIIRDAENGFWLSGLPEQVDVIIVGQEYVTDGRAITVTLQDAP